MSNKRIIILRPSTNDSQDNFDDINKDKYNIPSSSSYQSADLNKSRHDHKYQKFQHIHFSNSNPFATKNSSILASTSDFIKSKALKNISDRSHSIAEENLGVLESSYVLTENSSRLTNSSRNDVLFAEIKPDSSNVSNRSNDSNDSNGSNDNNESNYKNSSNDSCGSYGGDSSNISNGSQSNTSIGILSKKVTVELGYKVFRDFLKYMTRKEENEKYFSKNRLNTNTSRKVNASTNTKPYNESNKFELPNHKKIDFQRNSSYSKELNLQINPYRLKPIHPIISRTIPLKGSLFNNSFLTKNGPYVKASSVSNDFYIRFFKKNEDAFLYFPFDWEDNIIQAITDCFIDGNLWSIKKKDNLIIFEYSKLLHPQCLKFILSHYASINKILPQKVFSKIPQPPANAVTALVSNFYGQPSSDDNNFEKSAHYCYISDSYYITSEKDELKDLITLNHLPVQNESYKHAGANCKNSSSSTISTARGNQFFDVDISKLVRIEFKSLIMDNNSTAVSSILNMFSLTQANKINVYIHK